MYSPRWARANAPSPRWTIRRGGAAPVRRRRSITRGSAPPPARAVKRPGPSVALLHVDVLGLRRRDERDQGDQAGDDHPRGHEPRRVTAPAEQRDRQHRREADERRAEFARAREARVAHVGAEQLGVERALDGDHRAEPDHQPDPERQPDQRRAAGLHQQPERERVQRREAHAPEVQRPSPDAVRQRAVDRLHQHADERGHDHAAERGGAGELELIGHVGHAEGHEDVDDRGVGDVRAGGHGDVARVALDRLQHRQLDDLALLAQALEHRGLLDPQPEVQRDEDHQEREQERHAPAPGLQLVVGQLPDEQERQRAEHQPELHAELREGAVEAAPLLGRMFGQECRGTAELRAGAEALADPHQRQQDRRPDPDRRVRRQQADDPGRDPHQQRRGDQRRAPADPVAHVAEQHAADRPHREAHAERREGGEGAGSPRLVIEEQLVEHERGSGGRSIGYPVDRSQQPPARSSPDPSRIGARAGSARSAGAGRRASASRSAAPQGGGSRRAC